jgi:hypothetical protein
LIHRIRPQGAWTGVLAPAWATCALLLQHPAAFAQSTFHYAYGGMGEDVCNAIVPTGGGTLLVGQTTSVGAGSYDFMAVQTDPLGRPVWCATYGGPHEDIALAGAPTTDGGAVLAGYSYGYGSGFSDMLAVKVDAAGQVVWARTYGQGYDSDWCWGIAPTTDGGFILTGHLSYAPGAYDVDLGLVKIDAQGDPQWARRYGDGLFNEGHDVIQTQDGGYLATGLTHLQLGGPSAVFLVKTDSLGVLEWGRSIGSHSWDFGHVVREVDGGYLVAGYGYTMAFGGQDIFIAKVDLQGNLLYDKVYGGVYAEQITDLIVEADGTLTAAGLTTADTHGQTDFLLLRLTASGDPLWGRVYGGSGFDNANCLTRLGNAYLLAGYTESFAYGSYDFYLVRTGLNGNSGCQQSAHSVQVTEISPTVRVLETSAPVPIQTFSVPLTAMQHVLPSQCVCSTAGVPEPDWSSDSGQPLRICPNPSDGVFSVTSVRARSAAPPESPTTIEVVDVSGQAVLRETLGPGTLEDGIQLDLSRCPKGVYFMRWGDSRVEGMRKVVVY